MIQGIAAIGPHGHAVGDAGVEHQNSVCGTMFRKDAKHHPLVIVLEVEEAAPGQYSTQSPAKCQRSHVGNDWNSAERSTR